jgi:lysozyme family protein
MANIKKANTKYIEKWEGGIGNDPNDHYARYPVPDGSGNHTNKGVTWVTFKSFATKAGYTATPALFYKMPMDIWLRIYKIGFWDPMRGDQIPSQALAELLADFAWGSGAGGATIQLQKYLNKNGFSLVVDGGFGPKTLAALLAHIKKVGEKKAFEGIFLHRIAFLKSLADFRHFGTGWLNRMKDFYDFAAKLVTPKSTGIFLFVTAAAVTTIVAYNWDKIVKA